MAPALRPVLPSVTSLSFVGSHHVALGRSLPSPHPGTIELHALSDLLLLPSPSGKAFTPPPTITAQHPTPLLTIPNPLSGYSSPHPGVSGPYLPTHLCHSSSSGALLAVYVSRGEWRQEEGEGEGGDGNDTTTTASGGKLTRTTIATNDANAFVIPLALASVVADGGSFAEEPDGASARTTPFLVGSAVDLDGPGPTFDGCVRGRSSKGGILWLGRRDPREVHRTYSLPINNNKNQVQTERDALGSGSSGSSGTAEKPVVLGGGVAFGGASFGGVAFGGGLGGGGGGGGGGLAPPPPPPTFGVTTARPFGKPAGGDGGEGRGGPKGLTRAERDKGVFGGAAAAAAAAGGGGGGLSFGGGGSGGLSFGGSAAGGAVSTVSGGWGGGGGG
ncbi:hypothetical protein ScalyP_jg11282, partial [Parmales sp. scaly parma]